MDGQKKFFWGGRTKIVSWKIKIESVRKILNFINKRNIINKEVTNVKMGRE